MKKFLAVLSVALLAVTASAAHAKDWSIIRFGTDASYAPLESKAPNGKLVGFDIDLGNEICRRLHARCVWIENSFDGLIPGLKARKFDGIVSSLTITPQREAQIAFSSKMFNTPTRLVARKGSRLLPSVASLRGKSVGVEQGTIQETYAKIYWAPRGINVVSYQDQNQVYADLLSGRLDATLQDAVQADYGFLRSPRGARFAFVGGNINDPKVLGIGAGIGLRKEDGDLKQKIDRAIADMLRDGTYKRLASHYFTFDIYGG